MAAYAAGGAAALCAGLTGMGVCMGGITALALIPLYIKSDSSDNERTPLSSAIGSNRTLAFHTSAVIALAVLNNLMASGSRNGEIIIWDAIAWQPIKKVSVSGEINGLQFVDSFSLISVSSRDGLIFWDTQTGDNKFTFKNNLLGIMNSLVINSGRQEIIISTSRGFILIYSRFGEELNRFQVSGSINSLQKNPNQDLLTQFSTSIQFYTNSEYKLDNTVPVPTGMDALTVAAATKGINESLVYSYQASMAILDPNTGKRISSITTTDNVLFISQLSNGLLVSAVIGGLYFYNLATGLLVNSVKNIPTEITSMVVNGTDVIIGTSLNLIVVLRNPFVENNADFPEPEEPKLQDNTVNAHSQRATSLDTNNDDLIISGSLDGSVVFTSRSTTQIMKKFQFSDPIVLAKFDETFGLVVSSGGNLSKIDSNTFSLKKSENLAESVTSAQLINSNILVGTQTGFIRVFQKDTLAKIKDLPKSEKPIEIIANLNDDLFASSSETEVKIWRSDYSLLKGPIDTSSKVMAIFMISNKNLVTIGQNGLIAVWADQSFDRLSDSKISGSTVQVTSAVIANSGNIFLALKNSIIEYDLLNKIEVNVDVEAIGATQIIIDRFQRPIIGTENGSVIFKVTEIKDPGTETTQKETINSTTKTTQQESKNQTTKKTQQETINSTTKTTRQEMTTQQEKTTYLTWETSNQPNLSNLTTNSSSIANSQNNTETELKIFTALIIFISFLNKMMYFE